MKARLYIIIIFVSVYYVSILAQIPQIHSNIHLDKNGKMYIKIDTTLIFERKDDIAIAVQQELSEVMLNFGHEIVKALVTDIDPDPKVKAAMNEINEAQRLRMAANERGEAEKILKIKQAEGDAESRHCKGRVLPINAKRLSMG